MKKKLPPQLKERHPINSQTFQRIAASEDQRKYVAEQVLISDTLQHLTVVVTALCALRVTELTPQSLITFSVIPYANTGAHVSA